MGVNKSMILPGAQNVLDAVLGPVHRLCRTALSVYVHTAWHGVWPSAPRPPHSNGCPNQNLYHVYLSRSSLHLPAVCCLLFFPAVLLFTPSVSYSFRPHHRASYSNPRRDPLRRRNAALHCLPLSPPLPSRPCVSIRLPSSRRYHNDTCHDLATSLSISSADRVSFASHIWQPNVPQTVSAPIFS